MPVDSSVLGFANRWCRYAVDKAQSVTLDQGWAIRMLTAPAFVATKLDAPADPGMGDILASHDLQDVLDIVDGREERAQELQAAASYAMRSARPWKAVSGS